MKAVLAVEADPYVLPAPALDSLVVLPQWISPGNTHPHPHSRYRDMVWSLAPLIDNPGTTKVKIHWKKCPAAFLSQLKPVTWTMINGQLRPTYLKTRGINARGRTSATDALATCGEWIRLARWLHEHGVSSLADCTEDEWRAYAHSRVHGGLSRRSMGKACGYLTDLWAFDQLSAHPIDVTQPPWETEGIDDFLPAADSASAENSTEPLDPRVIGPLLVWAIRMVDDFADDILAAWAETRQLTTRANTTPSTPDGRTALEEFLLPLIASNTALPSNWNTGRRGLAITYIAARTGASFRQVDWFNQKHGLSALTAQRPGPCPLQVPVVGQINARPWRKHMDYTEAAELMRHLGTAAAIICLYLTGMRPQENGRNCVRYNTRPAALLA